MTKKEEKVKKILLDNRRDLNFIVSDNDRLKEFCKLLIKEIESADQHRNDVDIIPKCNCDKTQCVKIRNIGKFCTYHKHVVEEEFLKG